MRTLSGLRGLAISWLIVGIHYPRFGLAPGIVKGFRPSQIARAPSPAVRFGLFAPALLSGYALLARKTKSRHPLYSRGRSFGSGRPRSARPRARSLKPDSGCQTVSYTHLRAHETD